MLGKDEAPTKRFLIVRLSSIGDIVHALPAAAALAETFPEVQIHWVVEKRFAVLLHGNPHISKVVALDTLGWRKHLFSSSTWHEIRGGVADLRGTQYAAAFDFQGLWKSAGVAWLSRAQERIGFRKAWRQEVGASILYTQHVPPPRGVHVVEENLALVARLGARTTQWQFPLPSNDADDTYVENQLGVMNFSHCIIVNPGGGWLAKCWPPESYAALVRQLEESRPEPVLLTGSPGEEPLARTILLRAQAQRARYLPTTLLQFIALARRAALFIGGDTGPLHLAAAVGTPIVGIYGPTDPKRNGPFAPYDITLYNHSPINHARCGKSWISRISVQSVAAAVDERLARVHA